MPREIFYTFNASAPPADPTVNSTKYTTPLTYPVGGGYYKAIAREEGVVTAVTNMAFEQSPTDYIHYYPLTTDFNDHVGTNNLINTDCSIDTNGCLINLSTSKLKFENGLSMSGTFSIAFTFTPNEIKLAVGVFGTVNNEQIFRMESNGSWGSYPYGIGTATGLLNLTKQFFVIVQDGATRKYYRNGVLALTQSTGIATIEYIGNLDAGIYPMTGRWQNIKIFNRAVTADEAIQLTT